MKGKKLAAAIACMAPVFVHGFDFSTHVVLTYKAWQRLVLEVPDTLGQLGLVDNENAFATSGYYDIRGTDNRSRSALVFERERIEDAAARNNIQGGAFSIPGWLMRGAVREDDDPNADDPSPKRDDPDGDIHRVFRHFFDPVNNAPLTTPLGSACSIDPPSPCETAVNWAIGTADFRQVPNQPNAGRRNHFTVFDAREAMYRALTGRNGDGQDIGASAANRNDYWATAFRALGDVLHLNQDMAQPQHTRNESHSGYGWSIVQNNLTGHKSTFENFVEASVLGQDRLRVGSDTPPGGLPMAPYRFQFDGYPTPLFTAYGDFWFRPNLQGLANYSNRGFFTPVKNLGNPSNPYPEPNRDPMAYTIEEANPTRWDGTPIPPDPDGKTSKLYFFIGNVPDEYLAQPATGVRMTTRSAWNQFMQRQGRSAMMLTRENYIAQGDLLLPRAMAYSAGLLTYFFRGRMTLGMPAEGAYAVADSSTGQGFKVVKVKVTNASAESMDGGKVVAVIKHHRNTCYNADLSGEYGSSGRTVAGCREGGRDDIIQHEEVVVSKSTDLTLPAGQETTIAFDFTGTPVPLGISDVFLQVVYRGRFGNEDNAVVVGTRNISEPTYFSYFNASDYIHIAGHVYTRQQVNGDPSLLDQVYPQSCVDRTSTPRLRDGCLVPFDLDLTLGFASLDQPTASATAMPVRRFMRFAFLTDLAAPSGSAFAKTSSPTIRLAAQVRERTPRAGEKALLNQQSRCFPLDPFDVSPLQNQLDGNTNFYQGSTLGTVRGIQGWYQTSCVINGDASTPGEQDDRNQAMSALDSGNGETAPFELAILDAFVTPAP